MATTTTNADALLPWERQPGETADAFRAFCLYLFADPKTRAYDKLPHDHGTIRRWSKRWRWTTRIAEWEAWVVQSEGQLSETGRRRLKLAQAEFGHAGLAKAAAAVAKLDESKLSVEDVTLLATTASDLGRAGLGLVGLPSAAPSAAGVSVSFAPVWLQQKAEQNETKQIVVDVGEKVLAETPSGAASAREGTLATVVSPARGPLPALAEAITMEPSPASRGSVRRRGTPHGK